MAKGRNKGILAWRKVLEEIFCLHMSKGLAHGRGLNLFQMAPEGRTLRNAWNLQRDKFGLDLWKFFLTREIQNWNRLPWEIMGSPSLDVQLRNML